MVESLKKAPPIYLDYHATTPCDPRVLDKMRPWFFEYFGNAHSVDHSHGWQAARAVEEARKDIARLIAASPRDVIFTSGATESNNLALKGAALSRRKKESRNHIISVVSEHSSVLEPLKRLTQEGFQVTFVDITPAGSVNMKELVRQITPATALVSVMAANNEIGSLAPLAEIGNLCRRAGAWFHTDAAQAFGKIPLHVKDMNLDLLSISGHKIYGPKGIGALYIRTTGHNKVSLEPLIDGGGQERGLRSGTLPVPLCTGLGEAARLAGQEMKADAAHCRLLRDRFLDLLSREIPDIQVNGSLDNRLEGNLNITLADIEGNALFAALEGISVSTGSACAANSGKMSHVLQALEKQQARTDITSGTSLRISFGRFSTQNEVQEAARRIIQAVQYCRA